MQRLSKEARQMREQVSKTTPQNLLDLVRAIWTESRRLDFRNPVRNIRLLCLHFPVFSQCSLAIAEQLYNEVADLPDLESRLVRALCAEDDGFFMCQLFEKQFGVSRAVQPIRVQETSAPQSLQYILTREGAMALAVPDCNSWAKLELVPLFESSLAKKTEYAAVFAYESNKSNKQLLGNIDVVAGFIPVVA